MAPAVITNFPLQHNRHYGYAPPPSPPTEDTSSRCSLPSIHNLLGLADQGSPTSETSPANQRSSSSNPETRPNSSHARLPPSPPMSADTSGEAYHSPSNKSVSQVPGPTPSNYYFEATPPFEADTRPSAPVSRAPMPQYHPSYYSHPHPSSGYMPQPGYYSTPPLHQTQISSLFYQRTLPQAFPQMPLSVPGANPWQHHHYISPSSSAAFPQSQDRYVCQTCNKAFSRPSSLRIHSHSHTGEKPFKCPHAGCGKAFSVRSNMKRHERGCHSFESTRPA